MNGIYVNGMSAAPKPGVANVRPHHADSVRYAGQVYRVLDGLKFWVDVRK
jgi:hypothetical protein